MRRSEGERLPEKVEKKLVVVRSDILGQITEIARRENKTLFALVNEILQNALAANETGVTVGELADFYRCLKIAKDSGSLIVPSDLFISLMDRCDYNDNLKKEWYSAGQWYGKYLSAKFGEPIKVLPGLLPKILWHLSEVLIEVRDGTVAVSIIGPNSNPKLLELTGRYIEGLMHALGAKTLKDETIRGVESFVFQL